MGIRARGLAFASAAGIVFFTAAGARAQSQRLELGIGDRYDQVIAGRRIVIYKQAAKDGLRFKYVALWLTPGWSQWVKKEMLLKIARAGYTPLIVYYTFGDKNSVEYLEADGGARLKAWYADIQKNLIPLVDIGSPVLVALEPEFNIVPPSGTPITSWAGWNEIAGKAIDMIHQGAPLAKVGFCPGDWGNYNLEASMSQAARKSDFIAFPEMRASTDPTRNTASASYQDVIGSALAFSNYLKRTFHKPILWAYLALSSYAKGSPLGWQDIQERMIRKIFEREDDLVKNGVFGLVYFEYDDAPTHGTQFFGQAERHFGLKDAAGRPKKAWYIWKKHSQ